MFTWLKPTEELWELWIGFLLVPGVSLVVWTPLPELMEEVRDLFMKDSSASEVIPLFRLPGLGEERKHINLYLNSHPALDTGLWDSIVFGTTQRQK